jgi:hypothetical protein
MGEEIKECDCCGCAEMGNERSRLHKIGKFSLCPRCREFLVEIRDSYGLLGLDEEETEE